MAERLRPVAVLGGSFDPVHCGHTAVLEQVVALSGAAEGWLMPGRRHPLRTEELSASDADRLAMVGAAASAHPRLRVEPIELRLPAPTRTLLTLRALRQERPEIEPWWVVGADRARSIAGWYGADELRAEACFVCVNRSGVPPIDAAEVERLGFRGDRTRILHVDSPEVSSTEIRERLAAGLPVDGMLEPPVLAVVRERGLYGVR